MLKFDYTMSNGITVQDAYVWVANTNVSGNRIEMSGDVHFRKQKTDGGFYTPFNVQYYEGVPYDSTITDMPAKQFYTWLKTQPLYANATDYFPTPVIAPIVEPTA